MQAAPLWPRPSILMATMTGGLKTGMVIVTGMVTATEIGTGIVIVTGGGTVIVTTVGFIATAMTAALMTAASMVTATGDLIVMTTASSGSGFLWVIAGLSMATTGRGMVAAGTVAITGVSTCISTFKPVGS